MNSNITYRLTINGDNPRQYHLYSRWVAELYLQTYQQLGKQMCLEQLVDGLWQPVICGGSIITQCALISPGLCTTN